MGIKMPIIVEHRPVIYEEKPENMSHIKQLEDQIEGFRDALHKANSDVELAQKQIAALEAVRLAQPRLAIAREQAPRVEIKYQDKIVEVEKIVERIVTKYTTSTARDIVVAVSSALFCLLIWYSTKGH